MLGYVYTDSVRFGSAWQVCCRRLTTKAQQPQLPGTSESSSKVFWSGLTEQLTCPRGGAGTQVAAQQAHWDASLLDGRRLLESQCCDSLQGVQQQCHSQQG